MRSYDNIISRAEPFISSSGIAFARVAAAHPLGYRHLALRSPAFRDWFFAQAWSETNAVPTTHGWTTILHILEAQAADNLDWRGLRVARRVGERDHAILLDLANPDGEFVHISPDGWRIDHGSESGVPFETSASTRDLLAPEQPAADTDPLDQLRTILHLDAPDHLRCLSWLLSALRPNGPYPVLILRGPNGSGKSLAARVLRTLIDPATTPFNPTPRNSQHLVALARDNWVLAFDHVSTLTPAVSDTLCRLTSGVAIGTEFLKRPILLTVTDDFTPAPDLAARSLTVTLPPLADPRPESVLLDTLASLLPQFLGALCTAISRTLKSTTPVDTPTRHADTLSWSSAAFPALADAFRDAITAPPPPPKLILAVQRLLAESPTWTGTATDLLSVLPEAAAPNLLSKLLTTHAPALHDAGIRLKIDRSHGIRSVTLSSAPAPHHPPQPKHIQPLNPAENIPTDAPAIGTPTPVPNPEHRRPRRREALITPVALAPGPRPLAPASSPDPWPLF